MTFLPACGDRPARLVTPDRALIHHAMNKGDASTHPAGPMRDNAGMSTTSRALSFDKAAGQYATSRPSYPAELLDAIEEFTGNDLAGARVADVGAGTGIATALLRDRGAEVIAVEPGEAMACECRERVTGVPVVRGDGNALPLAKASRDLITYAQAWQWTDPAHSVPEALRVLRPGGALAIWWNTTDFDVPWIRDQHTRMARHCGATRSPPHAPRTATPSAWRASRDCGSHGATCPGPAPSRATRISPTSAAGPPSWSSTSATGTRSSPVNASASPRRSPPGT